MLRRTAAVLLVVALVALSVTAAPDDRVAFNTKSHIYHCLSCSAAKRCTVNCVVTTRADAVARGGRACKICGGSCKNAGP